MNWVYSTLEAHFYNYGDYAGLRVQQGMSKSKMGLQSLSQGSWERVWNGEGRAGLGTRSSENRTKVCGWMGYMVGGLGTIWGHGEVWIGVPVQCYTECNNALSLPVPPHTNIFVP